MNTEAMRSRSLVYRSSFLMFGMLFCLSCFLGQQLMVLGYNLSMVVGVCSAVIAYISLFAMINEMALIRIAQLQKMQKVIVFGQSYEKLEPSGAQACFFWPDMLGLIE